MSIQDHRFLNFIGIVKILHMKVMTNEKYLDPNNGTDQGHSKVKGQGQIFKKLSKIGPNIHIQCHSSLNFSGILTIFGMEVMGDGNYIWSSNNHGQGHFKIKGQGQSRKIDPNWPEMFMLYVTVLLLLGVF